MTQVNFKKMYLLSSEKYDMMCNAINPNKENITNSGSISSDVVNQQSPSFTIKNEGDSEQIIDQNNIEENTNFVEINTNEDQKNTNGESLRDRGCKKMTLEKRSEEKNTTNHHCIPFPGTKLNINNKRKHIDTNLINGEENLKNKKVKTNIDTPNASTGHTNNKSNNKFTAALDCKSKHPPNNNQKTCRKIYVRANRNTKRPACLISNRKIVHSNKYRKGENTTDYHINKKPKLLTSFNKWITL